MKIGELKMSSAGCKHINTYIINGHSKALDLCPSDKQCRLRNLPKVSSQMVLVIAWTAKFIPTTPQDRVKTIYSF